MLKTAIQSQISLNEITFKPGGDPVSFAVKVVNSSDRFASFQLEMIPAGGEDVAAHLWYQISPDISSKTPPGGAIEFKVTIFDTPIPGFVGQMNTTVRVFAMELGDESRQSLRLILQQGTRAVPLRINLPIDKFQALPQEEVIIPVRVNNPSQLPAEAIIRVQGIDASWFGEMVEQRKLIKPGKEIEVKFVCQIPFGTDAPSQEYPFTIAAQVVDGAFSQATGTLEILPMGNTNFLTVKKSMQMPPRRRWWLKHKMTVRYPLTLENSSNLPQEVSIEIQDNPLPAHAITIEPSTATLAPQTKQSVALEVKQKRPIFGQSRSLTIILQSTWSDRRVDIQNETIGLQLKIKPILPIWVLLVTLFGTVPPALWWQSCLNPHNRTCGHQGSVSTVQLNGSGDRAISGSGDQTMRLWDIAGFATPWINQEIGIMAKPNKAVRVVRYKPTNNDQVVLGLENGEIQLWDLLKPNTDKPQATFGQQQDDRVLDLRFTSDSRSLFSAHGSGRIYHWRLDANPMGPQTQPQQTLQTDFAIYGTAVVGSQSSQNAKTNPPNMLAIAGKFNRIKLWDWQKNQVHNVSYLKSGGQYDYIQSLATADYKPQMMASADTQGTIAIWDMSTCLADPKQPCKIIDHWDDGHGRNPVKSVALSRNGCYLVSGGSDGRVVIWPLSNDGKRSSSHMAGIQSDQSFTPKDAIESVDIKVVKDELLILSGSEDTQIRATTLPKPKQLDCGGE